MFILMVPSGSSLLQRFAELRWFAEFAVSLRLGMVPLNGDCPAHCDEPSARTATGRRCSLYSCIEFVKGAHFSNSAYCPGASSNSVAQSQLPAASQLGLNPHSIAAPLPANETLGTAP